jgi:hypothetical protein
MPITVNTKWILDRKQFEMVAPAPLATASGSVMITDDQGPYPFFCYLNGINTAYLYDPREDGWQQLPNAGLSGTGTAGSCGTWHPYGPSGTASAGTTTTITTTLTIPHDISGYTIRLTGGPSAGDERVVLNNTQSTNAVITVTVPFTTTPTSSTTFQLLTGRYWFLTSYSAANVGSVRYWDRATATWNNGLTATTNMPATWGTDGQLVVTPGTYNQYSSSMATSGASTTLTDTTRSWTTNQWANFQVRIYSGTGAGQIRIISSNTATVLTVSVAWTTNPDSTSKYYVEGCDDSIYVLGNSATTVYRISVSAGTWNLTNNTASTLGVRPAVFAAGNTADWVFNVPDSRWTVENYSAATTAANGRYIYSWNTNILYRYDITTNTWATISFYPGSATGSESFAGGSCSTYDTNNIFITNAATGRIYRFSLSSNRLYPWANLTYANGAAIVGEKMCPCRYNEGGQSVLFIYYLRHTGTEMFRCMDIRPYSN